MQTTQNNYNYGKKFRKYTYSSIPISFCILALLVVGYSLVNPSVVDGVYAVEDSDSSSIYASDSNEYSNSGVDGGLEEGGDEGSSPSSSPTPTTYDTDNDISSNSGIMPLAYNPSASLTVSNTNLTTQTVPGEVAYLSSNVTYSANDISSYSMKISYAEGNSSLSNSNITDSSGNTTTITGAGGKTPASMSSNSWGYALADTNANNTTLTYNTMPSYGSAATIVSGNAESVPTTTKKLVFASKFATNANPGHYRTKVLLSLTATPKVIVNYSINYNCNGGSGCPSNFITESSNTSYNYTIPNTTPTKTDYKFIGYNTSNSTTADSNYAPGKTITLTSTSKSRTLYAVWELAGPSVKGFGGIRTMQDMTTNICKGVASGTTGELYDTRDNSVYSIRKHEDGNCWMTSNLKLTGTRTLTPADSNITNNYVMPSTISNLSSTDFSKNDYDGNQSHYANNAVNGVYYSWAAATAGTGTSSLTASEASSSICPKGWKLPAKSGSGSYDDFMTAAGITKDASGSTKIRSAPYSFPYSGSIRDGSVIDVGSYGNYWSRTISYDKSQAYRLIFQSSTVYTTQGYQYRGYSIRCVALGN